MNLKGILELNLTIKTYLGPGLGSANHMLGQMTNLRLCEENKPQLSWEIKPLHEPH